MSTDKQADMDWSIAPAQSVVKVLGWIFLFVDAVNVDDWTWIQMTQLLRRTLSLSTSADSKRKLLQLFISSAPARRPLYV